MGVCVCVGHKLDSSCHECVFEGINALKGIQMGDRDDDGAVLYAVAQGCFMCLLACVFACLFTCMHVCYVDRECESQRG